MDENIKTVEPVISFRDAEIVNGETPVIYGLDMDVYQGDFVYIVGKVGTGKTSIIRTIIAENPLLKGSGKVCGYELNGIRNKDIPFLRRKIGVVFQDFQLISQSLGSNVAGSVDYDPQRVKQALADAGFGPRLESLPKGLDTQLYKDYGEDGIEVSGGEAQKIAIARALYKDAPFIVLDEPTAALDPVAEAEIYAKFNEISGDKTAIYISHRLSSCKFCDEIAVFDHGEVVQQGTHEALLSDTNGKYCELWNAQAQYYTEETA